MSFTNPVTLKEYKGENTVTLALTRFEDRRFATYKQFATIGRQVKRGEKGTTLKFFKPSPSDSRRLVISFFTVFNIEQTEESLISEDLI